MMNYEEFLERKAQAGADHGFEPLWLPDWLFDFQRALVEWAIRKGRAAIFADCGLGKTPMQLVWAENVLRKLNRPVLILTPLAVSHQTVREGEKFGIACHRSAGGTAQDITVAHYEQLHKFTPDDFGGVVCDESSILKSFDGARRTEITAFMRKVPYRLLATATAAPNDYVELGTSSEALGYLGHMDMLGRFFVNDRNNIAQRRMYGEAPEWMFKGHAETPFWRWVSSWARAVRRPSDLGFNDGKFLLPRLSEVRTMVGARTVPEGMLFEMPTVTLAEQRAERKRTIEERCERAASLLQHSAPGVAWCHLNDEGALLERLIPGAVEVSGSQSDEEKEERFIAFASGEARVLVTKPRIGAWGLNWQHCSHLTYFPSHSYEQYYQAVRRCWRFGQTRAVQVDLVMTEGDARIMENLQRKSEAADEMFSRLVAEMSAAQSLSGSPRPTTAEEVPQWL